jgi:FPC/CPF motif-containing protein YcgG
MAIAQTATSGENLERTVRYLIDVVAQSDRTFIRNNEAHMGKEAAEHLKYKYEYFKEEIKTPEDFIRLAATKSLMTGKPYLVKTKDGKQSECAEWLGDVLDDYRKSQKKTP